MKNIKNFKTTFFTTLIVVIVFPLVLSAMLALITSSLPLAAQAQKYDSLDFTPQTPISGTAVDKSSIKVGSYDEGLGVMTSDLLAKYIQAFYNYGLAAAGILAAIVLMAGGLLWLTSGGNDTKIGQAKELITGSIAGTLILFSSWIILNTINPDLLKLKIISMQIVNRINIVCCELAGKAEMLVDTACKGRGGTQKLNYTDQLGIPYIYGISPDGKKCALAGCCLERENYNDPTSKIMKCSNSMYASCYAGGGYFKEQNCLYVGEEMDANGNISSCKNRTDVCATAEDSDYCFSSGGQHWCYNKLCWHGKGQVGEPCGNELNSKCDADEEQGAGHDCEQDQSPLFGSTRSCDSGLTCCKFKDNGDRINN